MKVLYLLLCVPFLNCSAQRKLNIETIHAQPSRITQEDPKTGRTIQRTTSRRVTAVLEPMIKLQRKEDGKLTFLLQGNITSGGHTIYRVKKSVLKKSNRKPIA